MNIFDIFSAYYEGKFTDYQKRIKNILIDFFLILLKLKFRKTKL